jgi:YegS/Rv2252/BmrU family lipid kinase
MTGHTVVIVNPSSRSGRTGARLSELKSLLRTHVGVFDFALTRGPGDATDLTRAALSAGAERILVAGGDGTLNEVLNGVLAEDREVRPELGILPMGTGRDFARVLKLGTDLEQAIVRLARGTRRRVDAGRVAFMGQDGAQPSRCFLNIASFGLTGESALWLEERGRAGKRGKLSYATSGLVGLAKYGAPEVTLRADGELMFQGRLTLGAIANGQYFAGGMHVAPSARVDDCMFDVVVVPHMPLLQSLAEFPRLMRGTHVNNQQVLVRRARSVEAHSAGKVWIEADGEPIGTLPARFELLEGAITLCGMPD